MEDLNHPIYAQIVGAKGIGRKGFCMANNESQKRQLQAQVKRIGDVIDGLNEILAAKPNDRSAQEELRRQKQLLQGLRDELNNLE